MSIRYFECVFVALGMQHAMRMRHIVICGLSGSKTFFSHYLINWTIFGGKKIWTWKVWVFIFSTNLSAIFLILGRIQTDIVIYTHRSSCKEPLFSCQILMKLEFSIQIFEKHSNIKLHENLSSGSRVPCGRTDGQMDTTKQLFVFRSFANAPKTSHLKLYREIITVRTEIRTKQQFSLWVECRNFQLQKWWDIKQSPGFERLGKRTCLPVETNDRSNKTIQ